VDTLLAIASRREVRDYRPDPLPDELVVGLLGAGRVAGSGRNRQPVRFVVVSTRALLDELAGTVSRATNLLGAPLMIALSIHGEGNVSFDAGRTAQNMMLAAWNEGVGSCPNGFIDKPRAAELLGLGPEQSPVIGITFGYPARSRPPERHIAKEWLGRANRLPLDDLVLGWL
jgi:nitroreductase